MIMARDAEICLTDRDLCGRAKCNLLATITLASSQNSFVLMAKEILNGSIPMQDNASLTNAKK